MSKVLKVCHDRILPAEIHRPLRSVELPGRVRAVLPDIRKLWINGSTLRVRFMGGTATQKETAKEQALWWAEQAKANLKFDFNDAQAAEIRIAFNPNDGAWSYIGTDCSKIPRDQPTMNLGFLDGGTAAHEFGHAIGLGHEHQNPAGGIEWNEAVVIRDLSGPPNNWDPETIRQNVLEKYSGNHLRGTTFDSNSIMLYFFPDTWVKSGEGTKANDVLSEMDKAFIAGRDAYPPTEVQASTLRVNASKATKASIGKPGEEDLFEFTVQDPGRHVIKTGGQTDVVMKLFGPGSQTNLIAEDDDGGEGFNARIAVDLIAGLYIVQIRHYNRQSGTGEYTVRVTR